MEKEWIIKYSISALKVLKIQKWKHIIVFFAIKMSQKLLFSEEKFRKW